VLQKTIGRFNGLYSKKRKGIKLSNKKYSYNNNFKNYKIHNVVIATNLVEYNTTQFDSQNIKFVLAELLNDNNTFQYLSKMYQSYKIRMVAFKSMPRIVNGTQPKVCWITLDAQDSPNFNYVAMPQLQSSKVLSIKNNMTTYFKLSGRQDDFNYWYNANLYDGPTASIRLRSQAAPTSDTYWQFQVKYFISFRQMKLPLSEEIQSEKQDENILKEDILQYKKIKKNNSNSLITKQIKDQQLINKAEERNKSTKNLEMDLTIKCYIGKELINSFYEEKIRNRCIKNLYSLEEIESVKKENIFKPCDTKSLLFDWLGIVNLDGQPFIEFGVSERLQIVDILINNVSKNELDEFVEDYIIIDQLILKYGNREKYL
jgi:hypothetical protein